jgi:hypothetical protein
MRTGPRTARPSSARAIRVSNTVNSISIHQVDSAQSAHAVRQVGSRSRRCPAARSDRPKGAS